MARISKSAITRLEIIQVASRQFLEKGYSGTTVSAISKELEMSPGNLTFHFPTKEHLLAELVDLLCKFQWVRMKEEADEAKPTQKADCILTQENYQLIYVPVMKAELTYGDKVYTQWVNLVNGECQVEYAVAHDIVAAADKTMEKLARRKRSIFSCLLYALTFVALNVLQWQLGEPQKVDGGMEAWLLTVILGAIAVVELVLWAACFGYKKNKMIDRAVLENKMPSAKASVLWNLLAILLAIGSVAMFAVFALI